MKRGLSALLIVFLFGGLVGAMSDGGCKKEVHVSRWSDPFLFNANAFSPTVIQYRTNLDDGAIDYRTVIKAKP
jgi:hypothetical protein